MNNKLHQYLRKSRVQVFAAAAYMAVSQPAFSQLEEVLVFAQKTEENLQEVPIAVTAFTGDIFEGAGLTELADIERLTPNLVIVPNGNGGSTFAGLSIRGQTSGFLTLNADQAVGIYVDGTPITRGTNIHSNLFDIESVEVLKGPQGTLYGKNTTGGAISIRTKAPDLEEFGGYGELTLGNFGRIDVEGAINIPLSDTVAFRGAISKTSRDGFGRGSVTGQELADDDETFIRASLLIQPNENLSIRINAGYQDVDEKGTIFRHLSTVLGGAFALTSTDPDIFVGNDIAGTDNFQTAEARNINATIQYDLDWGTLESITSYRDQDAQTSFQSVRATSIFLAQDADLFSQELRLSGLANSDRLFWQAGVFYSDESGEDADVLADFGQFEVTSASNQTFAIFGQASYEMTEKASVTFGLRWTDETRDLSDLEAGAPILNAETLEDSEVTWSLGLDYKFSDNLFAYSSITTGFRSGAIDQGDLRVTVAPESVLNYELGIKSDINESIRLNAAFFYSDYTDIQRTLFDVDNLPNTVLRTAGEATLTGFEVELEIAPTENLNFGATLGYIDASYDVFNATTAGGAPLDRVDDSFGIPETQFSAYARYNQPLSGDKSLDLSINYFIQGENDQRFADTRSFDSELNIIDSYNLLNAQAALNFGSENPLKVTLFATNITDEEYFTGGFTAFIAGDPLSNRIVGQPRTYGVRLNKNF